jgi:hypothetical protein
MRVLIGCEESGAVREAFLALGHDAWSCDLKPSATPTNRHIIGDIRDVMYWGWDMMAVFHPPCTRLCNSGVRWLDGPPKNPPPDMTPWETENWGLLTHQHKVEIMWRLLDEGAQLFSDVWNAPIERIAVENPVMHRHAKERIRNYEPAAQTIQPWHHGEPFFKATSFYLKGLKPLRDTERLTPPKKGTPEHTKWSAIHMASPGPNRGEFRSKTFPKVARAMAQQWSEQCLHTV